MDRLLEPERLRHEDIEFSEESHTIKADEFDEYESLDSHAVVGLTNDRGEVLLQNDGSHGWTLPAFAVSPGDDWQSVAQVGIDSLTGGSAELDTPELVRRVEYRTRDDQTTMYTVVFRAVPVEGRPVSDEMREERGTTSVEWRDEVPSDQRGPVAADIRRFLD
ncbi:hypothetical protein ACFQJC_12450 [Haloferax namakaokahaiae]|uniref:Nudix hydrolase domain-containing protein n=1 Tax=Haloferax namakaokahaiae TaxID=1748331 RepID=A0ABD5ZGN1_9EURY